MEEMGIGCTDGKSLPLESLAYHIFPSCFSDEEKKSSVGQGMMWC